MIETSKSKATDKKKAWVVSALMGLGHVRAAYPLKDIAYKNIIIDGTKDFCSHQEYKMWNLMRKLYYFMSRAKRIPLVGKVIFNLLRYFEQIPDYYPSRDLSGSNIGVKYLNSFVTKKGLCNTLISRIKTRDIPVVNTFYATAMAIESSKTQNRDNCLLICDTDISRVWVPELPQNSKIKYLAPCKKVVGRLISYGVPEENIYLTGFPLPKENIGNPEDMQTLKDDLFERLLRLDPKRVFLKMDKDTVFDRLNKKEIPETAGKCFTILFVVGGAGVHVDMAASILKSLGENIAKGDLQIYFSAANDREVYREFKRYISKLKLDRFYNKRISIIYDDDLLTYYQKFNNALRKADVLWTKPSELSFYCALGIPILLTPAVGIQEEMNEQWLKELHGAISPPGPIEYTHQWLFDLREGGIFADVAWNAFLKVRKLGTFKIEELVQTGRFEQEQAVMEF
jgi:hypothetical protein